MLSGHLSHLMVQMWPLMLKVITLASGRIASQPRQIQKSLYFLRGANRVRQRVTLCRIFNAQKPLGLATPSPVRRLEDNLELPASLPSSVTFPMFRAASEPPPDIGKRPDTISSSENQASSSKMQSPPLSPVQEYSWEWGAFPQPSPVNTSFTKGGRMENTFGRSWAKGKGKANDLQKSDITGLNESDEEIGASINHEHDHMRSRSVPPELEGSPQTRLKELIEHYDASYDPEEGDVDEASFANGGILRPSKHDPSRFALQIEGRRIMFELSIVSTSGRQSDGALSDQEDTRLGWRSRHGKVGGFVISDGRDEVEAARLFALGKIDYNTFLDDDNVVENPGLVIRWAGNRSVITMFYHAIRSDHTQVHNS